jgi:hypothetical protein
MLYIKYDRSSSFTSAAHEHCRESVIKMSRLTNVNQKNFWILLIGLAGLLGLAAAFWPESNWYARAQVRDVLLKSAPPEQLLAELEPYIKVGDAYDEIQHRLAPQPSKYEPLTRMTEWRLQVAKGAALVVALRANGEVIGIGRWRDGIDKEDAEWLAKPAWVTR